MMGKVLAGKKRKTRTTYNDIVLATKLEWATTNKQKS